MFAEIRSEYLRTDIPCPLAMVVGTIGSSELQSPSHRPEGHFCHHMIWVEKGEGLFQVDGNEKILKAGEGLFCKKDIPHAYEKNGSVFSTRWVTFYGGDDVLQYFDVPDHFYFQATTALRNATEELERVCQNSAVVIQRSAAGYSWLTQWLSSVFTTPDTPITIISRFLETRFAEQVTLEDIAREVNMDRFTLCRYYKEHCGITIMDHLKNIRIAKAKQYLRYAAGSIEEIGQMCGFNSPSYFGKTFREVTGRTPREYREQKMTL